MDVLGWFADFVASAFAFAGFYPINPKQLTDADTRAALLQQQNTDLANKIKAQNDLIFQLQKNDDGKAQKIIDLDTSINLETANNLVLQNNVQDLIGSIEGLKTALALTGDIQVPTPSFLDPATKSYRPYFQFTLKDHSLGGVQVSDARDLYSLSNYHKQIILSKNWRKLSKYDKLMAAWDYVVHELSYVYDDGDNWQTPVQTHYRKGGDCEDGSIELLTFMRGLAIRGDEGFLVTGNSPFGYHAWPIAYLAPEDIKGTASEPDGPGWFIYETTIDFTPPKPRKLSGSGYKIKDGFQNWNFDNGLRAGHEAEFDTVPATPGAGPEPERVLNSLEKRQAIIENWKIWAAPHEGKK